MTISLEMNFLCKWRRFRAKSYRHQRRNPKLEMKRKMRVVKKSSKGIACKWMLALLRLRWVNPDIEMNVLLIGCQSKMKELSLNTRNEWANSNSTAPLYQQTRKVLPERHLLAILLLLTWLKANIIHKNSYKHRVKLNQKLMEIMNLCIVLKRKTKCHLLNLMRSQQGRKCTTIKPISHQTTTNS